MERIGIAASKIAKGNLALYNLCVVLIAVCLSLLIFFITGSAIVFVLTAVAYISSSHSVLGLEHAWIPVMMAVLICLFIVVNIFMFIAIGKNLRFRRKR